MNVKDEINSISDKLKQIEQTYSRIQSAITKDLPLINLKYNEVIGQNKKRKINV